MLQVQLCKMYVHQAEECNNKYTIERNYVDMQDFFNVLWWLYNWKKAKEKKK